MKKLLAIFTLAILTFGSSNIVNTAPAQAATFDDIGKFFGVLDRYYKDLKQTFDPPAAPTAPSEDPSETAPPEEETLEFPDSN
jgi:hypothetical protein